jgi:hypothetical protein
MADDKYEPERHENGDSLPKRDPNNVVRQEDYRKSNDNRS